MFPYNRGSYRLYSGSALFRPDDPFVYEAIVRAGGLSGDTLVPREVADALARMASRQEHDTFLAATLHLGAALVHENAAAEEGNALPREALDHYKTCLSHWPQLVDCRSRSCCAWRKQWGISPPPSRRTLCLDVSRAVRRTKPPTTLPRRKPSRQRMNKDAPARSNSSASRCVMIQTAVPLPSASSGSSTRELTRVNVADVLRTALDQARDTEQVVLVGGSLGRIARDRFARPQRRGRGFAQGA